MCSGKVGLQFIYAAAAKSLQSCWTLCNPIDGSPPGSPRPWDSPGKDTGVGCHFLLQRTFPTQGSNSGLPHCRQTISRSALNNPMPGHLFESKPVEECTTRSGTDIPMHNTEKHADSKHRSTSVLSSLEELERHAEFRSSTQEKA